MFQPVLTGNPAQLYADGGVKDRTGLEQWSRWSDTSRAIVHLVGTSRASPSNASEMVEMGAPGSLKVPESKSVYVVRTPKSRSSFFSLKDFAAQRDEAYMLSIKALLHRNFEDFFDRNE